tara:strand:+ start:13585 stop:14640 length:1056 start_codon:yes stop_codon:yes gene_type:complete
MERFDAGCLTDAKKEYTQRFVRKLKTPFCNKILDIFKEAQEECANSHEEDKILLFFQAKLEKVHEWEDTNIQMFSRTIISQSKCDYLEELLQGVFIVHTKVLAVIQHHKSTTKSELKLPTIEDFIYQAFINTARVVWKFAYLFSESKDSCEYQKNTNTFEKKIETCILETIEDMLPVRELLLEHVREYVEGESPFDDDDDDKKTLTGGSSISVVPDEEDINFTPPSTPMNITPQQTPAPPSTPVTGLPPSSQFGMPPLANLSEQPSVPIVPMTNSEPPEVKEVEIPDSNSNNNNNTEGGSHNILDSYSGVDVSLGSDNNKQITFDEPVPSANLTNSSDNMDKLESISYSQL